MATDSRPAMIVVVAVGAEDIEGGMISSEMKFDPSKLWDRPKNIETTYAPLKYTHAHAHTFRNLVIAVDAHLGSVVHRVCVVSVDVQTGQVCVTEGPGNALLGHRCVWFVRK